MTANGWAIALGYFDGVHIGHRQLIKKLCDQGRLLGLKTMVYTFDRHPLNVINPDNPIPLIYTSETKYKMLQELGVDKVVMAPFNIRVSRMAPEEFLEEALLQKYDIGYVVVGFNFRFGYRGAGDVNLLKRAGEQKGIRVDVISPVELNGEVVSSSFIRDLIRNGDIEKANSLLGSKYTVSGRVIRGKGRGNGMGIPTANIKLPQDVLYPARGVYITNTVYQNRRFSSITNVGTNPTFSDGQMGIETYINGLNSSLYNSLIYLEFFKKIRDEKKFENKKELRKQIELDIKYLENYCYQNE
jgi:riboflavin kinase/FMN adenylyltransferase